METQWNYKKTLGALIKTETWDEVGPIEDNYPTQVDPAKTYSVKITTEYSDTLEGVRSVTKTTEYTPIEGAGEFPDVTGPPTASVSYNTTFNRQKEPLESFNPAYNLITGNDKAANAFLSGQLVKQGEQWGYPQGVVGLLFTPVTLPAKTEQYKLYRDAGTQASVLLPTMTAEIKAVETYEGEINGNNGVPQSIKDMASDPDQFKPTVSTDAVVNFAGNSIPGCTVDLIFAGYSISNTITNRKVLEGGSIKTKLEYTISKSWQGVLNTGEYSKVELF